MEVSMGKLIAIEGPNFSGKTTTIKKIEKILVRKGYTVYKTKEPTSTPLGDYVRGKEGEYDKLTYAFLIFADRSNHIESEIKPKLNEYDFVITDRYVESSYVLQRYDLGDYKLLDVIYKDILKPFKTVLCTAPVEILNMRRSERITYSHFEKELSSDLELELYDQARIHLEVNGHDYLVIDTSLRNEEIVEMLTKGLLNV